jgi:enolase
MDNQIKTIRAREILDSRGNPTIEVECETAQGVFTAGVPSGASTGSKEAFELRDGGRRFGGKGVLIAVKNVNDILSSNLTGLDCTKQKEIDELMKSLDGTENKSNIGANAIVGASMAVCRAGAAASGLDLYEYIGKLYGNREFKMPRPCFNIINGGAHADNGLDFQEFMIVPRADSFNMALRMASEIYFKLKRMIREEYHHSSTNVGDEGGFAPQIEVPEVALALILKAIEGADYDKEVDLIIDLAASQFYKREEGTSEGYYGMKTEVFSRVDFLDYLCELTVNYPIIGLEDPFAEEDWSGFEKITARIGDKVNIIGDDLLVTNPKIIAEAQSKKACNAVILKINQIGTVSEILEAAKLAKGYGWKTVVSHRSGETCDSFIADLAVGISSEFIKSGAPARGERLAKYNRLSKIEERLKR